MDVRAVTVGQPPASSAMDARAVTVGQPPASPAMDVGAGAGQPRASLELAAQDARTRALLSEPEGAPGAPPDSHLEVHYVGELEFGTRFPGAASDDGLFVDYAAHTGPEWQPAQEAGYAGQTQTAYPDVDGTYVFNHPVDFHYFALSLDGWPALHVEVLKLDPAGQVTTVSYGSVALPNAPGHAELVCRTWSPAAASQLAEARAAHLGASGGALPVGRAELLGARSPEARAHMVTKTSGTVRLSMDTIFRNAARHGIVVPRHGR